MRTAGLSEVAYKLTHVKWLETRRGLIVGTIIVSAVYAALAITRHLLFGSGADLAIFDQAISAASRFEPPTTAMKQPGFSIFGDHFHPIIMLMVPLYWIWDDPIMLLIGQSLAIGAALYIFARTAQELLPGRLTSWLSVSLALSIGVQAAALYDFHELALGAPLMAMVGRTYVKDQLMATAWWGVSLLLVKEDMGVFLIGVAMALWFKGKRLVGVVLVAVALAYTWLVLAVIIPYFNPLGEYYYFHGSGEHAISTSLFQNLFTAFIFPAAATITLALSFASMGFLGWRSPLIWGFIGSWATRAAIGNPNYVAPFYQYHVIPAVLLAFAALDHLLRYQPIVDKRRELVVKLVTLGSLLVGPWFWSFVIVAKDAAWGANWAMAQVPAGARVVADVKLTPHLTKTTTVSQLRPPHFVDGIYEPMPDVEWVIVDTKTRTHSGPGWIPSMMSELEPDFTQTATDGRWVILKRR